MAEIRCASTDEDILRCFPVLRQLRPALRRDELVPIVRRMERQGYRLAYLEEAGEVRAVAGYRLIEMFRTGPMLEVDDLVTDEEGRSRGYGRAMFEWILDEARALGCTCVELDSAVHRHDAHRFYFRQRMHILAYHFSVACGGATAQAEG